MPPNIATELGVVVVPLHVRLGEASFRDGVDLAGGDFYERLTAEPGAASTSAPSPGEFLEAFRAAPEGEIVCVTLGSHLSGAYHEAVLASREFDGEVEVVDSGSATMGQGFVAMEAARLAQSGAALDAVAKQARDMTDRVTVLGAIETFEYLQRSGRVSKVQAYAATMLDIKPVFRLSGRNVTPVARPRTRGRALTRIVDETVRASDGRPVHVAAFHAQAPDDAAALVERVADVVPVVERYVVDSTPAVGVHTGPGLVGLAFFCD